MNPFSESVVEEATLAWFASLDYATAHGDTIAPEGPRAERESFSDVLLVQRLRDAIDRLNPTIPQEARDDAFRKVVRPSGPTLIATTGPSMPCYGMGSRLSTWAKAGCYGVIGWP